jgi:hypothetical protein
MIFLFMNDILSSLEHPLFFPREVLDLSCSFYENELRSIWACRKLHSVVLQADSFLSPQPNPTCFHSLGYLIVQPPVLLSLTNFTLELG